MRQSRQAWASNKCGGRFGLIGGAGSSSPSLTSSIFIFAAFILTGGFQCLGGISGSQAYVLPPGYPSMGYSLMRLPSFGSGSPDILPQRNSRRPQRIIQRLIEQQQPSLESSRMLDMVDEEDETNLEKKSRRGNNNNNNAYDSFSKFDPSRFEENTPEWNMAMIQYLLDMKNHGYKVKEIETTKSLPELHKELTQNGGQISPEKLLVPSMKFPSGFEQSTIGTPAPGEDPVICKMEPFNICYRLDAHGNMHPLGDRRPVRLLRVYK